MTQENTMSGDQKVRPKIGRKPLQPKNIPVNSVAENFKFIIKLPEFDDRDSNKENLNPDQVLPVYKTPTKLESSLAEELSAIKEKLERERSDRDKTEKMLKERELVLEMNMKELEFRGEIQKKLEIEVDRLYRLKQLHSQSMKFSPIRSLRQKEDEKKDQQAQVAQSQGLKNEDGDELSNSATPLS